MNRKSRQTWIGLWLVAALAIGLLCGSAAIAVGLSGWAATIIGFVVGLGIVVAMAIDMPKGH
jgi:hydrogenase/urease accessory protein HupE